MAAADLGGNKGKESSKVKLPFLKNFFITLSIEVKVIGRILQFSVWAH
jgi:hypothetical protein